MHHTAHIGPLLFGLFYASLLLPFYQLFYYLSQRRHEKRNLQMTKSHLFFFFFLFSTFKFCLEPKNEQTMWFCLKIGKQNNTWLLSLVWTEITNWRNVQSSLFCKERNCHKGKADHFLLVLRLFVFYSDIKNVFSVSGFEKKIQIILDNRLSGDTLSLKSCCDHIQVVLLQHV